MSDHFEKFVRSNREKFDQLEPKTELWDNLQQSLNQQAVGQAATASTSGTGATGLAKISLFWKIAAVAVVTGITGTALYFGLGGSKDSAKRDAAQITQGNTVVAPNPGPPAPPLVNPPLADANVGYHTFTVEASAGAVLTLPNGSRLTVPANGFVTPDGQAVAGKVTLQYREFHDAADVILSGIPMYYAEKGKSESGIFQTAGMIEILGNQNGNPIAIAPEKPITIDMVSFAEEDNYNLYYLDTKERGWKDIGKAKMRKRDLPKTAKVAVEETAPTQVLRKPINPAKIKKNTELSFAVNYEDFPELKPFKDLRWVAADPAELKKKEWIFTQVWNDVQLERIEGDQMAYRFQLKNKKKSETIVANPLLQGEDYEKALADFNAGMASHKKLGDQRRKEDVRRNIEANVVRTFEATGFGTYNCDRIYQMPNVATAKCEFAFDDDEYVDPTKTKIFHVTGNFDVVIPIENYAKGYTMSFSRSSRNRLVAVLADGEIAISQPKEFQALELYSKSNPAVIRLHNSGATVKTPEDLRILLNI
jgi:hypothetical protein